MKSDRLQAVHRGKVDPGVDELPWDHVNRPKVLFTLYRIVKGTYVANVYRIGLLVHTGNASSGASFVPEQDCSAELLKVECIVPDRFLKRFGPSLNAFVGVKITTGLFIGEFERLQQLGPDLIRMQPNVACSPMLPRLKVPAVIIFGKCGLENRLNPTMHIFPVHTAP